MNLEQNEKDFLVRLLTSLTINPAQKDAAETVAVVQAIIAKLVEGCGPKEV